MDVLARSLLTWMQSIVSEAKDNLISAKVSQAYQANKLWSTDFEFKVGQQVMLSTMHRQHDFWAGDPNCVAKFMPRFDRPYHIKSTNAKHSTVTSDLPGLPNIFPVFHTSEYDLSLKMTILFFPLMHSSHQHLSLSMISKNFLLIKLLMNVGAAKEPSTMSAGKVKGLKRIYGFLPTNSRIARLSTFGWTWMLLATLHMYIHSSNPASSFSLFFWCTCAEFTFFFLSYIKKKFIGGRGVNTLPDLA